MRVSLSFAEEVTMLAQATKDAASIEYKVAKKKTVARKAEATEVQGVMQSLQDLLGMQPAPVLQLAHELRAPVASILNTLGILLQTNSVSESELRAEMLHLAHDRARAMLSLINDFLHLGREVALVQLSNVLWRVLPELRIKALLRGVELKLEVQDSLAAIWAREEHMEQMLYNLIDNAIKYTDPDGTVTVRLKEDGDQVVGKVQDTGIGIAPEDMPRIFEKFYRARNARDVEPYGTGLGLQIVQRAVELYDGQLGVESALHEGTKFTFTFPQAHEQANKGS
jgi:two-component system phosphate regulon sensor histidine kinase PhoR